MTKDTSGFLVTNLTKSYLRGGRTTKDTNGYLVTKIYLVLRTGWMENQGYWRVLGHKFLLSPTYGVNGRPRITTGTWSQKLCQVLLANETKYQWLAKAQKWQGHIHNGSKNKNNEDKQWIKSNRYKPNKVKVLHKAQKKGHLLLSYK